MSAQIPVDDRWQEFHIRIRYDDFLKQYRPPGDPGATGLRFDNDSVGYAQWTEQTNGGKRVTMRTTDGGRSWTVWDYLTPYIGTTVKGQMGVARKLRINGKDMPVFTRTGATGWLPLFDTSLFITEFVHGDFTESTLPRVMARLRGTRLEFTLDGGEVWHATDSVVIARIESYTLPPDTTVRYDTTYGISHTTLFGEAPADSAGAFVWRRVLGIVDSTLYAVSSVEAPATAPGAYHWKIDLARQTTVITPIATPVGGFSLVGTWIRDGLMLASATPAVPGAGAVARSTDHGLTWSVAQCERPVSFGTLRFTSPTYGICAEAYTTDAGATWHAWGAPFGVPTAFHAADSQRLYAGMHNGFYRSTDAGHTWDSLFVAGVFEGVWAGAGVMLAMNGTEGLSRTTDSGATWQRVIVSPDLLRMGPVAEIDPRNRPGELYAVARFRHATFDSVSAYVGTLRSTDAGASWNVGEHAPLFDANLWIVPDYAGTQVRLRPELTFVPNSGRDGRTAFLYAQDSLLYRSTDAGISWALTSSTKITGYSMADERRGISTRDGEMLRTEDGGSTWTTTVPLPPTLWRALALRMFDTLDCSAALPNVIAGFRNGAAVHSSDGGWTWAPRHSTGSGSVDLRGVFYWIDRANVYCTWSGQVLLSRDSGRAFVSVHPGIRTSLASSGLYDGRYIYYTRNNLDTVDIGRWRVDEGRVSTTPWAPAGMRVTCVVQGSPAESVLVELERLPGGPWSTALVDVRGTVIERHRVNGNVRTRFDARSLPSGRYAVVVESPAGRHVMPIVLVR